MKQHLCTVLACLFLICTVVGCGGGGKTEAPKQGIQFSKDQKASGSVMPPPHAK